MFNSIRQLLVDFLMKEYSQESAEEQIANANVTEVAKGKYSVLYDNGKADLVTINNGVVELVENFA